MDYYSVTIDEMPIINGVRVNAEQFLNFVRLNINHFTDNVEFRPYVGYGVDDTNLWSSTSPTGAVVEIDIPNDAGSVITSYASSERWTFTTIREPKTSYHPVSGDRDFGFTQSENGSYTFYTKGVDRVTNWGSALDIFKISNMAFNGGEGLWRSFQNKVENFVNDKGGSAFAPTPQIFRPNWDKVQDVMLGIRHKSSLNIKCK